MSHRILVIMMGLSLAMTLFPGDAMADANGQTQFPGAYSATTNTIVDPSIATIADGDYVSIFSPTFDQTLITGNFVQPIPGIDMPPYNATIISVSFLAIVSFQYYRNFSLSYGFETVWGTTWYHEHWFEIADLDLTYPYIFINVYWNITSYESWTYGMLVDSGLAIRLFSDDRVSVPLNIDYVGIEYNWTGIEEEEDGITIFGPLSITGVMGVVGLIGMVATVPTSIWLYRRDGGSKILAGVVALGAFLTCITLFLASLGA